MVGRCRRRLCRPLPSDVGEGRAPAFFRGRPDGSRPGPAMATADDFPAALRAVPSRSKIAGLRHPPLPLRSLPLRSRMQARSARRLSAP